MNYPCFIDFEASSLSEDSYPIEVAWSDEKGEITSFLINPESASGWDDWDEIAEEMVHGISREQIVRDGQPAWLVARRMNEALKGKVVYTDALVMDDFWLKRLFAEWHEKPAFQLADARQKIMTESGLAGEDYEQLEEQASGEILNLHRAEPDIKKIMTIWRASKGKAAGD